MRNLWKNELCMEKNVLVKKLAKHEFAFVSLSRETIYEVETH